MKSSADLDHMRTALALARRGLGNVWPNPAVGCVIVDADGAVVGRGWTQPGGRPHAETEALTRAGAAARGGTAYVTLEPCSHHGKTPPCAEALIAAGIVRVVVATGDPDPRVNGQGVTMLRDGGLDVDLGVAENEAKALNAGFISKATKGRPWVTLKLATTLDGRLATASGESQWITGDQARARGHLLRAESDAIMVGVGTAIADDPSLTCRLDGLGHRSPVRVVMDGRLRLPADSKLVMSALEHPTWVVTTLEKSAEAARPLLDNGVEVITVPPGTAHRPAPDATLRALARRDVTRVLVEGGAGVAASFLATGLVDEIVWFRAGSVIGGDGLPAVGDLALERLGDAPRFERVESVTLGPDTMERFVRATENG